MKVVGSYSDQDLNRRNFRIVIVQLMLRFWVSDNKIEDKSQSIFESAIFGNRNILKSKASKYYDIAFFPCLCKAF